MGRTEQCPLHVWSRTCLGRQVEIFQLLAGMPVVCVDFSRMFAISQPYAFPMSSYPFTFGNPYRHLSKSLLIIDFNSLKMFKILHKPTILA